MGTALMGRPDTGDASPVVDPADLVTLQGVMELLSVRRTRVKQIVAREDFPAPVTVTPAGRLWSRTAVLEWRSRVQPGRTATTLREPTRLIERRFASAIPRRASARRGGGNGVRPCRAPPRRTTPRVGTDAQGPFELVNAPVTGRRSTDAGIGGCFCSFRHRGSDQDWETSGEPAADHSVAGWPGWRQQAPLVGLLIDYYQAGVGSYSSPSIQWMLLRLWFR